MKIKNTTYTIQNDNCRCEFDDRKDKTEWLIQEEIKEILDDIKRLIEEDETPENMKKYVGGTFNINELKLLSDYITNLQEENERLSVELNQNMIERNNYLSRNEKAIYDLEKTKKLNDRHILARDNIVIHLDIDHIEYLLNILKGDNK